MARLEMFRLLIGDKTAIGKARRSRGLPARPRD